ncbi:hypothetical protein KI387_002789, partial [Taxus chinensis]
EHMNVSKDHINYLKPISPSYQLLNSNTMEKINKIQIQKEFSSSMENKEEEILSELEDSDNEEELITIDE